MENRICKSMKMFVYILTPELSPLKEQLASMSGNQVLLKKGLMGYAKSAVWILLSIMLSLALGQLN